MSDTEMCSATLLGELAALEPQARHQLATTLRQVSETLVVVPDGQKASYVLGVLAQLLDPERSTC